MATVKKVKKAQDGTPIIDRLAAKTAERNTKGPALREGQKKRLDRIAGSNVDRAIKVGKRMLKRAAPAMKKGGKVVKKAAKKK
jgi:hypothetical protein